MKSRLRRSIVALGGAAAACLAGYFAGRARADGVPATAPLLTYSGYLEQASGQAVTGPHAFVLRLWDAATDGTMLCQIVPASSIDVSNGHFQIPIADASCAAAIHAHAETWVEVLADGDSVGRSKVGAVPYALEADRSRDAIGDLHPASVTAKGDLAVGGSATFHGPIDLEGRLTKTAPMTGANFATQTVAGTNVCSAGYHPCQAFEMMVIDTLSSGAAVDQQGWVGGSFLNLDAHMRSLANGQDSVVCPANAHLTKYPSKFVNGTITAPGGLHCIPDTMTLPVWCCRNKT
jgi:hypothetical protein